MYRAADGEIAASIPARDYELMGEVLAEALEATAAGHSVRDALRGASAARGDAVIRRYGELEGALTAVGYEPATGDDGVISLTNCPFHRLAASHGELVCQANLGLVAAMAAGATPSDGTARDAVLAPAPGRCCVQLVPAARVARIEGRAIALARLLRAGTDARLLSHDLLRMHRSSVPGQGAGPPPRHAR